MWAPVRWARVRMTLFIGCLPPCQLWELLSCQNCHHWDAAAGQQLTPTPCRRSAAEREKIAYCEYKEAFNWQSGLTGRVQLAGWGLLERCVHHMCDLQQCLGEPTAGPPAHQTNTQPISSHSMGHAVLTAQELQAHCCVPGDGRCKWGELETAPALSSAKFSSNHHLWSITSEVGEPCQAAGTLTTSIHKDECICPLPYVHCYLSINCIRYQDATFLLLNQA